jgi:hypothetical protein
MDLILADRILSEPILSGTGDLLRFPSGPKAVDYHYVSDSPNP